MKIPSMYYRDTNAEPSLPHDSFKHLWSIILAGGNGSRVSDLIRQWKGRPVPKQYCAFVGTKSMLEHTILRADKLIHPERQRILIARDHYQDARPQLADRWSKSVISQPSNCDTLPGIFLPLTHVYARDSKATAIIYPSDHFIHPQECFLSMMESALQAVEDLPDLLVLVGVPADSLELDYGWVCPAEEIWRSNNHPIFKVKKFLEKPSRDLAETAMACGGMWNTLIMVVKAHTLWQLGLIYAPEILRHFESLYEVIGTCREERVLESIYEVMPSRNFSKDLLTPAADHIGLLPMKGVLWSDWGRMQRIVETLDQIGKQPNFPMILASANKRLQKQAGNFSMAS
jgi:mannose-1-phosphate guanylyltransferase